jgi:hypothetical protein
MDGVVPGTVLAPQRKAPANRQGTTRVLIVNCTSIDVGCNLARPWLPGTAWPKQHGPSKIQLLHGFPSWASTPTPSWKVKTSPPCNLPLCLSCSLINTQNNNHHNVRKETGRRPGTASSKAAECGHESRPHPPGRVGERCTHPDSRFSRFGAHQVVSLPPLTIFHRPRGQARCRPH